MYERITGEDPYKVPMRIYPAVHYTMGGLWVDYDLQSNVPGLFVVGEANFSDHGANRLGASALMQGLADGYFVLPSTISDYLAPLLGSAPVSADDPAFKESEAAVADQTRRFLSVNGKHSVDHFHRELGNILWDNCGMARSQQSLEKAGRVADFLEFGELLCLDALTREESCGGHLRVEHQTEDGEALRDDDNFSYVAAWEHTGSSAMPVLHREPLEFEYVHLAQRSY